MKSWNNPGEIALLYKCSQISSSPRVASTSNRIKTTHHWLVHLQKLNTLNYANSLTVGLKERCQTPRVAKRNLGLPFLPYSI